MKPSPARWPIRDIQRAFDDAVRKEAAHGHALTFVDASAGLLVNGYPGAFFTPDNLHVSAAG